MLADAFSNGNFKMDSRLNVKLSLSIDYISMF